MHAAAGPSHGRLFLLFFLALNFLFLLTSSGRVRTIDEVTVAFQTESLATRGSTSVPQAITAGLFYGNLDRAGHPQAPYGMGQALLVLPWHVAGRALRAVLPGIPDGATDAAGDAVLTASSATFSALAAALALLIFLRLGIAVRIAVAAALILALATPVFAYSTWFFSEPLAAALLLGAALFIFTGPASGPAAGRISMRQAVLGGLALSVALWVRPTHAIAVPVFLTAMLVRDGKKAVRPAVALAVVVALFGGAYLLRNQFLFGGPFDFGYSDAAEGGKRLNSFQTPLVTGLYGFLASPGKSVFLFAPPVLLAIAGIRRLWLRDRGLAVCAAMTPLVYLFLFSGYTQWEGGYCFGPRYLLPGIALLGLGLGPMLEAATPSVRRIALALFIAGFLVQGIGISTSFLEDQANGTYYDQQFDYRMSYAPLVSQTRLLVHHATSGTPALIGRGFDRWFVFLRKAGIARGTILAFLALQMVGAVFFTWKLRQLVAKYDSDLTGFPGSRGRSLAANADQEQKMLV